MELSASRVMRRDGTIGPYTSTVWDAVEGWDIADDQMEAAGFFNVDLIDEETETALGLKWVRVTRWDRELVRRYGIGARTIHAEPPPPSPARRESSDGPPRCGRCNRPFIPRLFGRPETGTCSRCPGAG